MCRVWWKRGERPPGLCDKRFTFAYIFAAVEPGTDNAFTLVLPYANTEAMQVFLDQFAATIGEDEHVALILDQAGWHGAHALRVPANITLVDPDRQVTIDAAASRSRSRNNPWHGRSFRGAVHTTIHRGRVTHTIEQTVMESAS